MKPRGQIVCSVTATLLILVLGGQMIWQNHQRIERIEETRRTLKTEPGGSGRAMARVVKVRGSEATLTLSEVVALSGELAACGNDPRHANEIFSTRAMALRNRLIALDPAILNPLLAEISASREVGDGIKDLLIGSGIMALANDRPDAALQAFAESAYLFRTNNTMGMALPAALKAKTRMSPDEAVVWYRQFAATHSGEVVDAAKSGLLAGAASADPSFSLRLLGEFGAGDEAASPPQSAVPPTRPQPSPTGR